MLLSLGLLGRKHPRNRETGKQECETKDSMIQRLLDHFAGKRSVEGAADVQMEESHEDMELGNGKLRTQLPLHEYDDCMLS